jgi:hypothetical protein
MPDRSPRTNDNWVVPTLPPERVAFRIAWLFAAAVMLAALLGGGLAYLFNKNLAAPLGCTWSSDGNGMGKVIRLFKGTAQ